MPPLVEIRNLTIQFSGARRAAAVRDLNLTLESGEVLGLVGESGSGKSVTSLALMRLLPAQADVSGEIRVSFEGHSNGQPQDLLRVPSEDVRQLRGLRMAMIFQEPMTALNPVMRIGDQIAEAVHAHQKISAKDAEKRAIAALDEVAIPDPARRAKDYPYQLSGGMRQRVMIAMAIVNRPQLLIADEPTTALDVTIQAQILDLLADLRAKFSLTMLFVSHDLAVVSQVSDRVAVMYAGSVVELGTKEDVFHAPGHPYTRGLLNALPTLHTDRNQPLKTIEGFVPASAEMSAGCPFAPRCEFRIESCSQRFPELLELAPGHWARCPVLNPVTAKQ